MVLISELVPAAASAEEWRRYHVFRRRQQAERRPDEPVAPDEVEERVLRLDDGRSVERRWLATAGDEAVGLLGTTASRPGTPEYASNRHLMDVSAYVLRSHRRRGVGRALLRTLRAAMDDAGATTLTAGAEDEPGHAFLRRLGAEPRMTERESVLDLRRVDWDLVDRWVRDGGERSPGARLTLHATRVPPDELPAYVRAMNEFLNTMPFEDLDHGEIAFTVEQVGLWHEKLEAGTGVNPVVMVRDHDGSIVGVTDVLHWTYQPRLVHQFFTGVHPRARGRRIGRWIKAAMLRHLRQAHPGIVRMRTGNAGSNRWMLAINEDLGFRPEREVTYYQLRRERLPAGPAARD